MGNKSLNNLTLRQGIFSRLYEATLRIAGASAGVAIWGMALLIFTAVVARYVFDFGIIFAVEFPCYLTCFVCFIGACYTQRAKGHVSVDLVVGRLPKRIRQWLEVVSLVISSVVCSVFLYWFTIMTKVSVELGARSFTGVQTLEAIPQSATVIGFSLLLVVLLVQLVAAVKELRLSRRIEIE